MKLQPFCNISVALSSLNRKLEWRQVERKCLYRASKTSMTEEILHQECPWTICPWWVWMSMNHRNRLNTVSYHRNRLKLCQSLWSNCPRYNSWKKPPPCYSAAVTPSIVKLNPIVSVQRSSLFYLSSTTI